MKKLFTVFIILSAAVCTAEEHCLYQSTAQFLGYPYEANTIACNNTLEDINNTPESFDCVTFIEHSVALCLDGGIEENTAKLRYFGSIQNCSNRKHFFVADWLKHNNIASDHTKEIAGKLNTSFEAKKALIDRQTWFLTTHAIEEPLDAETVDINYIAFKNLDNMKAEDIQAFPRVSLMLVVNEDRGIDISHTGFLFNTGDTLIFRHASSAKRQVTDEELQQYIGRVKDSKKLMGLAFWALDM